MVSATPTASAVSSLTAASRSVDPVAVAKDVMAALLSETEIVKSLADQSTRFLPPTNSVILATLWGALNSSESFSLSKSDVQKALYNVGKGDAISVDALWSQLNPSGSKTTTVTAGDFSLSEFVQQAVADNMSALIENIADRRNEDASKAPKSGTLFDFYPGTASSEANSTSILDFFI